MGKTLGSGNERWKEAGRHWSKKNPAKAAENLRASGHLDPDVCRQRRLDQIRHETEEAKRLEAQGYEVFSPTVVCDRIAIKDGKVYFVEFKRPGQKLRPGQQAVAELVPAMYIVQFSE